MALTGIDQISKKLRLVPPISFLNAPINAWLRGIISVHVGNSRELVNTRVLSHVFFHEKDWWKRRTESHFLCDACEQ